jgi:hypothetical protein
MASSTAVGESTAGSAPRFLDDGDEDDETEVDHGHNVDDGVVADADVDLVALGDADHRDSVQCVDEEVFERRNDTSERVGQVTRGERSLLRRRDGLFNALLLDAEFQTSHPQKEKPDEALLGSTSGRTSNLPVYVCKRPAYSRALSPNIQIRRSFLQRI